jgi:hypothetical protein
MEDLGVVLIPVVAIIGCFAFVIVLAVSRGRVRELAMRERIAMIERGLIPPPEVDPRGFDRAMTRLDRHEYRHGSGRHQRAGVTLMGVGFGLMVLIGVAFGNSSAGFGVGGFLVIMGLAFLINSRFEPPRDAIPPAGSRSTSSPPGPAGTIPGPPPQD